MANTTGYHSLGKSIQIKVHPGKGDNMPPQANVLAAVGYVRQIFESKKLAYSIMGGFQMFCLGNEREVPDIHFAYEDKDFNRIRKKIEADRRLRSPEGMNPLTPSKILVQTGPSFHDVGCSCPVTVEVYLLPSGSYGTPPSGTLKDNVVLLSNNTGGMLRTFKGLNMLYLVRSLIEFCKLRNLSWNPHEDILFLCQRYGGQVQAVRSQLDQKATHHNFLMTPFLVSLPLNEQRRCYQILSGQAPPATIPINSSLPPRTQSQSQSAYGAPSSQMSSEHSSFLPKAPGMNNLQNLQQMQKERTTIRYTVDMGLPSKSSPNSSRSSEATAPAADSRARYRPMSAYNTRRISSGPQLRINTSTEAVGGAYAYRKASVPLQNSVPLPPQQSNPNIQHSKPSSPLPATLSIVNRQALTKSDARSVGKLSSYMPSHRATYQYIPGSQKPQQQHQAAMFEMSATPVHTQGHNSMQYKYEKEEQKRLQVVGPNGLYQPSSPPPTSVPPPPPPPPPQLPAFTRGTDTLTDSQPAVYELDSIPAETTEENDIIASLSAHIESAMFSHTNPPKPPPTSNEVTRNTILPTSLVPGHADKSAQRPYTPPSEGKEYELEGSQRPSDEENGFLHVGLASPPLTPAPLAVYKAYRPQPLSVLSQGRVRSASNSPPVCDTADEREAQQPQQQQQKQEFTNGHNIKAHYPNNLYSGHTSIEARLDSSVLAMEYQAELPDFEHGYAEH